jgi:hypothetical protein
MFIMVETNTEIMPIRLKKYTDKHLMRVSFDKNFLRELQEHNEITLGTNGKVYGLEACMKRLWKFWQARLVEDYKERMERIKSVGQKPN